MTTERSPILRFAQNDKRGAHRCFGLAQGWSADAVAEGVGAEEEDLAAGAADEALVLEGTEPAVDGLAAGADHAGEGGLGEVDGDRGRGSGGCVRGAGEAEEDAGQAAGDVEEDGVLEELGVAADPLAENLEELDRHLGAGFEHPQEAVAVEEEEPGVLGGHGIGGAGAAVEDGQLAEELAGAEQGEDQLAAVGGGQAEADLPALDDAEALARGAAEEDGLASPVAARPQAGGELGQVGFAEAGEERDSRQRRGTAQGVSTADLSASLRVISGRKS